MEELSKRHGSLSGENEPLHVYVTSYDREALSRGCEKVRDIIALLIQDQEYELNTNGSEDPPAQNVLPWGMEAHFVGDSAERMTEALCPESGCVANCFREDPASIAKKPAVLRDRINSVPENPSRGIQHFCEGIDRHKSEAIQLCPEKPREREKGRIVERYPDYDEGIRRSEKKKKTAPSFRSWVSPLGEWEELSAVENNPKKGKVLRDRINSDPGKSARGDQHFCEGIDRHKSEAIQLCPAIEGEDRFVVPSKSSPKGILRDQREHRKAPPEKKFIRFEVKVEVHTVPNRSDLE